MFWMNLARVGFQKEDDNMLIRVKASEIESVFDFFRVNHPEEPVTIEITHGAISIEVLTLFVSIAAGC